MIDTEMLGEIIKGVFLFAGVIVTAKYTKNAQIIRLEMRVNELIEKFTKLDRKVDTHNNVITRTFLLEEKVSRLEEDIKHKE